MKKAKKKVVNKDLICKCGAEVDGEYHSCPYAAEIGGNDDPEYCNCCRECSGDCCMEI